MNRSTLGWAARRQIRRLRAALGRDPQFSERHVVYLPKANLAYIRIPKAANTSIRTALAAAFDLVETDSLVPNRDRFWVDLDETKAQALTHQAFQAHRADQNLWCFSFVRHPLSRLYSCWENKVIQNDQLGRVFQNMGVKTGMSFDAFVECVAKTPDDFCDIHVQSQASLLVHNGVLVPDFVGRVENIDQDWAYVRSQCRELIGVELGALPKKNVRAQIQPEIASDVSKETLERIKIRYAADFKLFYSAEKL